MNWFTAWALEAKRRSDLKKENDALLRRHRLKIRGMCSALDLLEAGQTLEVVEKMGFEIENYAEALGWSETCSAWRCRTRTTPES